MSGTNDRRTKSRASPAPGAPQFTAVLEGVRRSSSLARRLGILTLSSGTSFTKGVPPVVETRIRTVVPRDCTSIGFCVRAHGALMDVIFRRMSALSSATSITFLFARQIHSSKGVTPLHVLQFTKSHGAPSLVVAVLLGLLARRLLVLGFRALVGLRESAQARHWTAATHEHALRLRLGRVLGLASLGTLQRGVSIELDPETSRRRTFLGFCSLVSVASRVGEGVLTSSSDSEPSKEPSLSESFLLFLPFLAGAFFFAPALPLATALTGFFLGGAPSSSSSSSESAFFFLGAAFFFGDAFLGDGMGFPSASRGFLAVSGMSSSATAPRQLASSCLADVDVP